MGELHVRDDADLVTDDHFARRVGASIVVVTPVQGLGFARTAIARIENAVAVVVGIGASVLVLERVAVFGDAGAAVVLVDDAIAGTVTRGRGALVAQRIADDEAVALRRTR
jgi:hypothetical protein